VKKGASTTSLAKEIWSWDWLWKQLFTPWRMMTVAAVLFIFGLVFAIVSQQSINRGEQSLGWPTSEGTVLRSSIVPVAVLNRQGRETRHYMAACIECVYQANGRTLEYSWQESVNIFAVLEKYPAGRRVKIYYDPEMEDATLHPGVRAADRSIRLWSVLATALGAAILVPSMRKMWRTPAA